MYRDLGKCIRVYGDVYTFGRILPIFLHNSRKEATDLSRPRMMDWEEVRSLYSFSFACWSLWASPL